MIVLARQLDSHRCPAYGIDDNLAFGAVAAIDSPDFSVPGLVDSAESLERLTEVPVEEFVRLAVDSSAAGWERIASLCCPGTV